MLEFFKKNVLLWFLILGSTCVCSQEIPEPSSILIAVGKTMNKNQPNQPEKYICIHNSDFVNNWSTSSLLGLPESWLNPEMINDNQFVSSLKSLSCTGHGLDSSCYTIGGAKYNYHTIPSRSENAETIFAVTQDGKNWSSQVESQSTPIKLSCTGENRDHHTCAVLTTDHVSISQDSGQSWIQQPIDLTPYTSDINCTSIEDHPLCVTVTGINNKPVIYVFNPLTQHWDAKNLSHFRQSGPLSYLSCAGGDNKDSICVAIGGQGALRNLGPTVAVSHDAGNTWYEPEFVNDLPLTTNLFHVECIKNEYADFCLIGGSTDIYGGDDQPAGLLFVNSSQHNKNWKIHLLPEFHQYSGYPRDISCIANQHGSLCAVVGMNAPRYHGPVIFISRDQGETWSVKKISAKIWPIAIHRIRCSATSSGDTCIASGINIKGEVFMVKSNDFGESWNEQKLRDVPQKTDLNDVAILTKE